MNWRDGCVALRHASLSTSTDPLHNVPVASGDRSRSKERKLFRALLGHQREVVRAETANKSVVDTLVRLVYTVEPPRAPSRSR